MLNVLVGLATVFHFYEMLQNLNKAYVMSGDQMQKSINLRKGLKCGLLFALGMSVLILNIFF